MVSAKKHELDQQETEMWKLTRKGSPVIGLPTMSNHKITSQGKKYLQLRHECFDRVKEFACGYVRGLLEIQAFFEC
jgi:hypothetical protein